jgi:replicative DNA helicase
MDSALLPERQPLGPPFSLELEQGLLGAALFDATACRGSLPDPSDFHEPVHGRICGVIADQIAAGQPVDLTIAFERLRSDGALAELGGRAYLAQLVDKAPSPSLAPQYGAEIADLAARRKIMRLGGWSTDRAADVSACSAHQLIAEVEAALAEIATGQPAPQLATAQEAGLALAAQLDDEAVSGLDRGPMTGLRCIDRRCRGLRPGWVIVIGGRPSMGKTALARALLYGAAARNPDQAFLFFALEMDRREITERALSAASFEAGCSVPYVEMGGTDLLHEDRRALHRLAGHLPANLYIDDRASLSVADVRRAIWALRRSRPVGAVVIDYLQLMERPTAQGRNDAAVISEMTKALKQVAKETGCCIVLLSQLSRAVESRDDKRPQLADLRESGSIEQDANVVLFPYREAYYVERAEPADKTSREHEAWSQKLEMRRRRLDVIAAKVRGGAAGVDRQACWIEYDHIADLDGGR